MIEAERAIVEGGCTGDPRSDVTLRALAEARRIEGRLRGLASISARLVRRMLRR